MAKLFEMVDPSQLQDVLRGVPELGKTVKFGSETNYQSRNVGIVKKLSLLSENESNVSKNYFSETKFVLW